MRRKLTGLCWLLWRYCLWWLPLAVLSFWAVALIHHAQLHGGLLWRPWTVFGALWVFLSIILSWFFQSLQTWINNCHFTSASVRDRLSWHSDLKKKKKSILKASVTGWISLISMHYGIFGCFYFPFQTFLVSFFAVCHDCHPHTHSLCLVGWCGSFSVSAGLLFGSNSIHKWLCVLIDFFL